MRRHKFSSFRRFEVLEDRRMMTGDISYNSSNRVLTINGAGLDDVAEIRFEGNRVYAELEAEEIDDDGDLDTEDHELDKRISDVSKIVFNGFAGNDELTVLVNQLSSGVTLNNILLEFHGGDNDDQLHGSMHNGVKTVAFGHAGNDILKGSKYDDVFEGGTGDDTLSGGGGNDKYVFAGTFPAGATPLGTDTISNEAANVNTDTLDFSNFTSGVSVDIGKVYNPNVADSYAVDRGNLRIKLDIESAIENIVGSSGRDILVGNSRANYLIGGGSSDDLEGKGGNDILEGGGGGDVYKFRGGYLGTDSIKEAANIDWDFLDFDGFVRGVTVDLTKSGSAYAVNNADLKLLLASNTAIENVYGSQFDDTIIGNSRENTIDGLDGNDTISGGAGFDQLWGGTGDDKFTTDALDRVYGNAGRDWFDKVQEPAWIGNPNPKPDRYMDWAYLGLLHSIV